MTARLKVIWTQTGRVLTGAIAGLDSHTATVRPGETAFASATPGQWAARIDEHRGGDRLTSYGEPSLHRSIEAAQKAAERRRRAAVRETAR